jgi:hypothetical protein
MYFEKFPKILYDFNIGSNVEYKVVTDITRNVRIIKDILSNITLYDEYDIRDGDTPEIVADKFYGSPMYHWIVMLTNERYDYVNDWPLPTFELEKHIEDVYGFTTIEVNASDVASVALFNNTIYKQHPFQTGDRVIYSNEGNTSIGGLVNNRTYYAIRLTDSQFKLATTRQKALALEEINLTSLSSGTNAFKLNNQYNVHHYEDINGNIVPEVYINIYGISEQTYPVSNYEYEDRLNESKRRIRIITPQLLARVLQSFEEII